MSTLQFDQSQLGFNADVVVIGAGLSGLVATRRLVAEGVNVLTLEARERSGGPWGAVRSMVNRMIWVHNG